MGKNSYVFFAILITLFSCQKKEFDSLEGLNSYVAEEENGLKYSKTVNGINYVLQYRPTDVLVHQELSAEKGQSIEKLRGKYKDQLYFNLSMSMNNKELLSNVGDRQKFADLVNELLFNMDERVYLVGSSKDTIPLIDFVYPRMYGMSPSTTILLVYPREKINVKETYLNLIVEDIGFNTGEVKFKVSANALINEPEIKF